MGCGCLVKMATCVSKYVPRSTHPRKRKATRSHSSLDYLVGKPGQFQSLLIARLEAATETALAVCLLLGLFSNLISVIGILLALGIWSIPEGFGGPYQPGQSTDIGTALPYALLFGMLLVTSAGRSYSLDQWLTPQPGSLSFLASGHLRSSTSEEEEPAF